jgi:hypothetical protein
MKSPPREDVDTGVAGAGLLDELSVAVRAGRLVALLKGEGLNQGTVDELLRPESIEALQAILTDHLHPESEHGARNDRRNPGFDNPGNGPAEGSGRSGDARPEKQDGQAARLGLLFGTEER